MEQNKRIHDRGMGSDEVVMIALQKNITRFLSLQEKNDLIGQFVLIMCDLIRPVSNAVLQLCQAGSAVLAVQSMI